MSADFKTKVLIEKSKQENKNNTYFRYFIISFFIIVIFGVYLIFKENFQIYINNLFLMKKDFQEIQTDLSEKAFNKENTTPISKTYLQQIEINLKEDCNKYKLEDSSCNIKNLFQVALKDYNDISKELLSNKNIFVLFPNQSKNLINLKNKSLEEFSNTSYDIAYKNIIELKKKFNLINTEFNKAYKENLNSAKIAYDNRESKKAKVFINEAEKYFPENDNMLILKNKIMNIASIIKLENQILEASIKENLILELSLINKIKKADKLITKYDLRLNQLKHALKKQNFNNLIKEIRISLSENNTKSARIKLNIANKIFPENKAILSLKKEIITLEKKNKIKKLNTEVKQLILDEKWELVEAKYNEILSIDNTNYSAVKGIKIAKETNRLIREMIVFNNNPMLLTKNNNLSSANISLDNAKMYKANSKKLLYQSSLLMKNINLVNEPAIVNIISDRNTEIILRKVGVIGKVFSKDLKLKPGLYTFEGKRAGYKTILINKIISIEEKKVFLEIICYEPI